MNYYDLPENIHYEINKIIYLHTIVPQFKHKDWWWHTVKCRANVGKYKILNNYVGFLDSEIYGGSPYFSYGVGKNNKRKLQE